MNSIKLYHSSFDIIEKPDIHHGRKNADFAQGFYLSAEYSFSMIWSRIRKGQDVYINKYELLLDDLNIKQFSRDLEWINYIISNRNNIVDTYKDYDLIIGPIANDTIFDTFGLISSNILNIDTSLKLLQIGPEYNQYVLKTEKALNNLSFLGYEQVDKDELIKKQEELKNAQDDFQKEFVEVLEKINNDLI